MSTPPRVPLLQVWRGALLLTDFILQDLERWSGVTVVELGAGTGKPSYCLSFHAAAPTPASLASLSRCRPGRDSGGQSGSASVHH